MISKIFITGQGFGGVCRYLCRDLNRSQVLAVEGVRGHDLKLMQKDFEVQHQFMPAKEKPVFHGVLSFPPGEDPGNQQIVEIARRYLDEIGMGNTQYALVRHTDKLHQHLHILANRVNNEGRIIGQGLIIERGIKAAQKLTQEYGLQQENGKNLGLTHLESLHEVDGKRYRLYQAIREALPECRRMEDLAKRLLEKGISTRYKYDQETHERVGVSFHIENFSFKGSKVDPAYSLPGLQKILALQIEQDIRKEQALKQPAEFRQEEALKHPSLPFGESLKQKSEKQDEEALRRGQTLRHRR